MALVEMALLSVFWTRRVPNTSAGAPKLVKVIKPPLACRMPPLLAKVEPLAPELLPCKAMATVPVGRARCSNC